MTDTTSTVTAASPAVVKEAKKETKARFESKGVNIGIIICAVLAVLGIVLWIMQLSGGMIQTGMRNLDSWGLYITMFMFFVGLSAGGLIISSVPKAFGIKGFGGISKVAVFSSVACTVAAIGFVIVDLGQPGRIWELFAFSNMMSPLMWDIIVLGTYLILSCVYLWAQIANERGRVSNTALRVIAVIALVCAVFVHTVTAWIFGLQPSREMWYTALLGPWFVSSALVCGTALVMIVGAALTRAKYITLTYENLVKLAKLLGAFLCVDLYFYACDLLTEAFPAASGTMVVDMLVAGPLAPFFWIEIILSVVAIVICFAPSLRSNALLMVAAASGIIAIFCKRVSLLVGGFQLPNLDFPAVMTPFTVTHWQGNMEQAYSSMVYWPAPIEFGVALGVIALAGLVFLLGVKYLALRSKDSQE